MMSPLHQQNLERPVQQAHIRHRQSFAGSSTSTRQGIHTRELQQSRRRGDLIICMASERRIARVSKQLEREIGALLQGDPVVQTAICPERRAGFDSSLSALASVTEVRLSSDLQVAKIYLSVYSDEEGKTSALQGLSRLQGYVRTKLASQMRLRMMPEIRFMNDDAAEKGEQVLHLLERIKRQNAGEEDLPPIAMPPLTKQQADGGPLKPRPSREELLTEDGFLDLGNGDELEEGFLPQIDADYGAEEGDEVLEDEILEDELLEDDLASSDARVDVIDAFLGGKEDLSARQQEEYYGKLPSQSGKGNQKKSKRR